jgi:hypothetical protein
MVSVGAAAGLALVPVVGSYLGLLLGGFLTGLVIEKRPLVEGGVAAVLASLGILVAGSLDGSGILAGMAALASLPPLELLTSSVLSFAVGAFGAHFGDDLRAGVTTPVGTTPDGSTGPRPTPVPASDEETASEEATDESSTAADTQERSETRESGDGTGTRESEDLELERE